MATYPPVIGGRAGTQRHKINQIYGTVSQVTPVRKMSYQQQGKPNMFKRMIRGLVNWSMREEHTGHGITIAEDREEVRIGATGMKFEVYRANGGTVVETRRYNRKSDENIYELHVITDSQDIGQEIGRIITMEALKS